jgi:citrate synthase
MPAIAALAYHRASGRNVTSPNQRLSYSENFLYMLDASNKPNYRPNPRLARAMDIMFTLHAEHEMNCSTAAARHLASSGVDVYTAIAGGVMWHSSRVWILWYLIPLDVRHGLHVHAARCA